jgi:hypothetical protein
VDVALKRELDALDRVVETEMRLGRMGHRAWGSCYLGVVGMYPTMMSVPDINQGVHFVRAWNLICSLMGPRGRRPDDRVDGWVSVTTPLYWTDEGYLAWTSKAHVQKDEGLWHVLNREPPGLLWNGSKALLKTVVEGVVDP